MNAETYTWEPGGWQVSVEEVSMGVYEIKATSHEFGSIETKSDQPDEALRKMRLEAQQRADAD